MALRIVTRKIGTWLDPYALWVIPMTPELQLLLQELKGRFLAVIIEMPIKCDKKVESFTIQFYPRQLLGIRAIVANKSEIKPGLGSSDLAMTFELCFEGMSLKTTHAAFSPLQLLNDVCS